MSGTTEFQPGRRGFLTGLRTHPRPAFRPPWTDEHSVTSRCIGCGACVKACPEDVLGSGPGGSPQFQVGKGECTFCHACADACDEGVFLADLTAPWPVVAAMEGNCLLEAGISCRVCPDACPTGALGFDITVRPVGAIRIDAAACTGCGACLPPCPMQALALRDGRQTKARA